MENEKILIGENIRVTRKALNLSLKEVGDSLGTSHVSIRNIEKNEKSLVIRYLAFLAEKGANLNKLFSHNELLNK